VTPASAVVIKANNFKLVHNLGLGISNYVDTNWRGSKQNHQNFKTLKVYSNELFLFQLTNDLCTSFTKIVVILFLSKAIFIKITLLFQYFVLKIEQP